MRNTATLYEQETQRGVQAVQCVDCESFGDVVLTVHPLRLCREHFIQRYGSEGETLANVPTWDDQPVSKMFYRYDVTGKGKHFKAGEPGPRAIRPS